MTSARTLKTLFPAVDGASADLASSGSTPLNPRVVADRLHVLLVVVELLEDGLELWVVVIGIGPAQDLGGPVDLADEPVLDHGLALGEGESSVIAANEDADEDQEEDGRDDSEDPPRERVVLCRGGRGCSRGGDLHEMAVDGVHEGEEE
eukprot:CAMPEP_0206626104 /NCGR_PEP_ID=MMETSP0325_2-20121206/65110_1 /ASSEMBLY_ACC=CAM_ASM_000347 /TAXON_ID=2866 /ORGANISM="Crypthecodinium cohnii, Strain Seligo" /LENGTH=148 /DNA_ID=CAMNT_0054150371 /DNA_START=319 /DNA_END=762 /DNA_ORIENTATION=-